MDNRNGGLTWPLTLFCCTMVVALCGHSRRLSAADEPRAAVLPGPLGGERPSPNLRAALARCIPAVRAFALLDIPFEDLVGKSLLPYVPEAQSEGGESAAWRSVFGGFDFVLAGRDYKHYFIRVVSRCGGRNYLFDPRANVLRLEFRSPEERLAMGRWFKRFYNGELLLAEQRSLYMAIPHLEGIRYRTLVSEETKAADYQEARSHLAELLGDFLLIPELEDFVVSVAFDDRSSITRLRCLRSIISVWEYLPRRVQKEVAERAADRWRAIHAGEVKDRVFPEERDALDALRRAKEDG
jgi:hypothetical protein